METRRRCLTLIKTEMMFARDCSESNAGFSSRLDDWSDVSIISLELSGSGV